MTGRGGMAFRTGVIEGADAMAKAASGDKKGGTAKAADKKAAPAKTAEKKAAPKKK